jgi:hypothetical protein
MTIDTKDTQKFLSVNCNIYDENIFKNLYNILYNYLYYKKIISIDNENINVIFLKNEPLNFTEKRELLKAKQYDVYENLNFNYLIKIFNFVYIDISLSNIVNFNCFIHEKIKFSDDFKNKIKENTPYFYSLLEKNNLLDEDFYIKFYHNFSESLFNRQYTDNFINKIIKENYKTYLALKNDFIKEILVLSYLYLDFYTYNELKKKIFFISDKNPVSRQKIFSYISNTAIINIHNIYNNLKEFFNKTNKVTKKNILDIMIKSNRYNNNCKEFSFNKHCLFKTTNISNFLDSFDIKFLTHINYLNYEYFKTEDL